MKCVHRYRPAEGIAETYFANRISIQHSYHAYKRPHERVTTLDFAKALVGRWEKWLLSNQIAKVIRDGGISKLKARQDPEVVEEQLGFLDRQHHRMLCGTYRSNGWFVDSGVVEVACRTVVGRQLKQCGVFWSIGGAVRC